MTDSDLPSPVTDQPVADARPANPWAIAALILGAFSQLYPEFWSGDVSPLVALTSGALALLLGIVGVFLARRGRRGLGVASAGLTCGVLTLINWSRYLLAVLALRNGNWHF